MPGGDLRPGDWMCPRCGAAALRWPYCDNVTMWHPALPAEDHVFARNEHCRPVSLVVVRSDAFVAAFKLSFVPHLWRCLETRELELSLGLYYVRSW